MIRFYTTVAQELYANPAIFTAGAVFARLLPASYTFNANHTLAQIPNGLSNGELLFAKEVFVQGQYKSFDAQDLDLGVVPAGVGYTSVVFYSNIKPLFIISDIVGLPGTSEGGLVNISFSSAENKIFRLGPESSIDEGSHFVFSKTIKPPPAEPEFPPQRSGADISADLVVRPKSGKSGMYSDLSFRGGAHPLTGDALVVYGESAINRSIRNIIMTNVGDRPFSSMDIAGNVRSWLFELGGPAAMDMLTTSITTSINNYEPRAQLISVDVVDAPAENGIDIRIAYSIKTTNTKESFSLFLERV